MDPLLDTAPCGFLSVADDGRVTAANLTVAGMLGLERAELVGKHVDVLLGVASRIFYQTHVFPTLKLQGTVHEVYVSLRGAAGDEVPVLLNAVRRARAEGFISDWAVVPMRQRNEYENEIVKARKAAEEAARAKDEFLAMASHELRSPLSAISGWAHLLAQGTLDASSQQRAVRAIQQNAVVQAKLVDDLLDYGRISSGELRLEVAPMRLDAVIASAVEGLLPAAGAKSIDVKVDIDARDAIVSGDDHRLRQVFWNILANAVKFTPRGGQVRVRLRNSGSSVEASVTDTGKGIAPEFLPLVFERFRQEDRAARREGGLGLGMSITRYLVELHGGTIAASSEGPGRGSTFTVKLPVAVGVDAAVSARSVAGDVPVEQIPQMPQLEGLDVLVVDDDEEAREWLRAVLEAAGASVRLAASVNEALRAYGERRPQVLVSDIEMEGGDGFALVRRIREIEETSGARTPAIALTGRVRTVDRLQALAAGFQIHLPKPVQPTELRVAIAKLRRFVSQPPDSAGA